MKYILTNAQLKQIEKDIGPFKRTKTDAKGEFSYSSDIDFLISKKVLKQDEKGSLVVMVYEGLGQSKISTGYGVDYTSDTPYEFWSDALNQLIKYQHKVEFAKKKEVESMENMI